MQLVSRARVAACVCGVLYVWALPLLARLGFAQRGAVTVSGFIANPPATGAMAAFSFSALVLMWEYQDFIIKACCGDGVGWVYDVLSRTLAVFQTAYGAFLVCTVGFVPSWLHTLAVTVFCAAFVVHAGVIVAFVVPSRGGRALLAAGVCSCLALVVFTITRTYTLWFWAAECVGLSAIFLFTPFEWRVIEREHAIASNVDTPVEYSHL